jgi:hypothetical protein
MPEQKAKDREYEEWFQSIQTDKVLASRGGGGSVTRVLMGDRYG